MNKNKMDFFETHFINVKYKVPDHQEIVVVIDVSHELEIKQDFFYGVPTELAYYNQEFKQWCGKSFENSEYDVGLDFRDSNHNISLGRPTVTHWIDKVYLSRWFGNLYEAHLKEIKEKDG